MNRYDTIERSTIIINKLSRHAQISQLLRISSGDQERQKVEFEDTIISLVEYVKYDSAFNKPSTSPREGPHLLLIFQTRYHTISTRFERLNEVVNKYLEKNVKRLSDKTVIRCFY